MTSFNEWGEGTQVEPASPKEEGEAGDSARAYPGYTKAPGGEMFYLEKVASLSQRWRAEVSSLLAGEGKEGRNERRDEL